MGVTDTSLAEPPLDRQRVQRRRMARCAKRYEPAAALQREVAERLLERLEPVHLAPRRVVDVGAATGYATRALLKRFRTAEVYAIEDAPDLLRRCRKRGSWLRRPRCICTDPEALPFPDGSIDLLFSNLALQWASDIGAALAEMRRVLSPAGALFFTTLGPQTLEELRGAWAEVDHYTHIHTFCDKPIVGEAMLRCGFTGPVVDGEQLTLTYQQPRAVIRELKALGSINASTRRPRGLASPHRLARVEAAYSRRFRQADGRVPATYEILYGHAWGGPGEGGPNGAETEPATSAGSAFPKLDGTPRALTYDPGNHLATETIGGRICV
ncbi:malonyl-[acyl-carrier protein] O-methyltransferase BioC [Halorhodospira abdelmalekii]|uniref:malonyl-ACP O-methyltransferase BioC n=1 Tax=Halorhodospira abdelmalekii TaxID=421629 RepID=UPI00190877F8|nr:malonyl-ACP O-methyltransferase BioC [Halorhodospira abdelmalekii]MBK1735275.1 malonyl-[acyl-carrier protein] O-methyltransferase BioC [Halorhodospira abdelmalekii]